MQGEQSVAQHTHKNNKCNIDANLITGLRKQIEITKNTKYN